MRIDQPRAWATFLTSPVKARDTVFPGGDLGLFTCDLRFNFTVDDRRHDGPDEWPAEVRRERVAYDIWLGLRYLFSDTGNPQDTVRIQLALYSQCLNAVSHGDVDVSEIK